MHFMGVNLLGVLAAAVACLVIGFLWYSPVMFAKPWMALMKIDPNDKAKLDEMKKSAGPMYGVALICSFLSALLMAKIFQLLGGVSLDVAIKFGVVIWIGFVMTVQLTGTLFGGRPIKLFLIDTGYQLVCYVVTGIIVYFLR